MTSRPLDPERTPPWLSTTDTPADAGPLESGHVVGRYRLEGVLGEGTYGRVHLARHEVLGRRVAVKVLHHRHGSGRQEIRAFLNEALILADLDHPGIVPIFDAGWTEDGLYYLVSKYVEGGDLDRIIRGRRLGHWEAAGVIGAVADALQYAHDRGLVHRDIKPGNILIDAGGRACLADFGVAFRDRDFGRGARHVGTPAYMSPELARGEGHRVDGRSDVFSLGVVLYELLTGQRPFRGATKEALAEQILQSRPRPPRQIDGGIPPDLERVCLRAMEKEAGRRYPSAGEMAEDLKRLLGDVTEPGGTIESSVIGRPESGDFLLASTRHTTPTWARSTLTGGGLQGAGIAPKGPRPFGADDAPSFPELLPGPRDGGGLPERIGFWRARIDGGSEGVFRVGLIFGPAGSGKTSLVRAGLLPRLSGHILWVYTEASGEGTESRLLQGIRQRCPGAPTETSLAATLVALRKGVGLPPGRKVLLVLDRFERCLRGIRGQAERPLVAALRQCDGEHLQALAVVRDDTWAAASRFMRDVGDPIVEGGNSAAVDLFDLGHARRVLEWFGRSYGALPAGAEDLTTDQQRFLDRAVSELAEGGQVLPIKLSLLAEAVRHRAWTPSTIEAIREGDVGLAFLEAAFDAEAMSTDRPRHRPGARPVLAALLPDAGDDVGDRGRSQTELLSVSGYARCPADFDDLLRRLVSDLGIVTSILPDGIEDGMSTSEAASGEALYRLTHDFLVAPLRAWLARDGASLRRSEVHAPTEGRAVHRTDGRRRGIHMARKSRAAEGASDRVRPIDINSATEDELKRLPGIGPSTARRIIEGRPYRRVEDLRQVRGIGRSKMSEIRPFVDVRRV